MLWSFWFFSLYNTLRVISDNSTTKSTTKSKCLFFLNINFYLPACQCNGHSTCVNSSVCEQCRNLTTGLHCETCLPGYHGDPTNGGKCQGENICTFYWQGILIFGLVKEKITHCEMSFEVIEVVAFTLLPWRCQFTALPTDPMWNSICWHRPLCSQIWANTPTRSLTLRARGHETC